MELTNMQRSDTEAQKADAPCCVEDNGPKYPWGLKIHLDKDSMDKLGMGDSLPKVGTKLQLTAVVVVTDVSVDQRENSVYKNVGLQITDMGLEAEKPKKSTAETLFPGQD